MNQQRIAGCAALLTLVSGVATSAAVAQEKHESNTLKKMGRKIGNATDKAYKASEYGVRKTGENVSVTTHRATGRNSVQRNRGEKQNYVVKPGGTRVPVSDKYNKPVKRDVNGNSKG